MLSASYPGMRPFNLLVLPGNTGLVSSDIPAASAQSLSLRSLLSASLFSALEACPPTGPWSLYLCLYAALLLVSCTARVPRRAARPVCRLTSLPSPTASRGSALSARVVRNRPRIRTAAPAETAATLILHWLIFIRRINLWDLHLPVTSYLIR